jgi:hypothetical protein
MRKTFDETAIQRGYTAQEFMSQDKHFQDSCANAGIPATKRQARKFLRKEGKAYASRPKG